MHQINIFTKSLFFTDQKDSEFKKETVKTKQVDVKKFNKIISNFVNGLCKNYCIDSQKIEIDNISFVEDLKNESNLNQKFKDFLFQGLYLIGVDEDCGLISFKREPEKIIFIHTDFIPVFNFIARENTVVVIPFNVPFDLKENKSNKKRQYIHFTLKYAY